MVRYQMKYIKFSSLEFLWHWHYFFFFLGGTLALLVHQAEYHCQLPKQEKEKWLSSQMLAIAFCTYQLLNYI